MIDIQKEELLTFEEARELCPRRRNNSRPHTATLGRWARDGYRGIKLEALRVGSTLCTSAEALQRFFEAVTFASEDTEPLASVNHSPEEETLLDELGL